MVSGWELTKLSVVCHAVFKLRYVCSTASLLCSLEAAMHIFLYVITFESVLRFLFRTRFSQPLFELCRTPDVLISTLLSF
jgi:hypothetical protein